MLDLLRRARHGAFVALGFLLQGVVAIVIGFTASALAHLVMQLPGGDAIVGAVLAVTIGSWCWYRGTVRREAKGGHLWWPGRVEDRW